LAEFLQREIYFSMLKDHSLKLTSRNETW